ncbi:MAG: phosphoribosyltransferase family protein [Bacteroidota bacterium]
MIHHLLSPLLDLLYPRLCLACSSDLPPPNEILCVRCQYELPETRQWLQVENAFTEVFWGRVPISNGAALYFFSKTGRVQHLVHQLKYENKPEIGCQLGQRLGWELRHQTHFQIVEVVVPVPLHPNKYKTRGYNQAEVFGRGVATAMELPLWPTALVRTKNSMSQTRKTRQDRALNVQQVFALGEPERLVGKHVLLVDDVLTTGATLETCARLITSLPGTKVSLATLAMADD